MDSENTTQGKKEFPRWLDRMLTIVGSTVVLTIVAVPTFFSKVDDLNKSVAEVKVSIIAMRSDVKTLSDNVNKARIEDLDKENRARISDVERIGNLAGRVTAVEQTVAQITAYKWNGQGK